MKKNIREYQTLKFFRGRERKNAEMQKLSDEGQDFDYRRLLIEENELDMHVAFSKMIVYRNISWGLLVVAISFYQIPIMSYIFLALAILSQFFSFLNKRFFQFVFRSHNMALRFVESVIFDKYGISF